MDPVPPCHWQTCPPGVRAQGMAFVDQMRELVGEDLVGVYLHGSLAMGCFQPGRSDLDLLAVTRAGLSPSARRALAAWLLTHSGRPCPLEIHCLRWADLHPWRYPLPFDFHFSEAWRERFQAELASEGWRLWIGPEARDPDLAAHITVLHHRGVVLWGRPIPEVFPPIPPADYLASIRADVAGAGERIPENPVYLTLNLCRVYRYLQDGAVTSKAEAGAWAAAVLPRPHRDVVARALAVYEGRRPHMDLQAEQLRQCGRYLEEAIARLAGEGA